MTIDTAARRTYASRTIAAPPEKIFAVLSDASLHPVIDGSSMVKAPTGEPQPLHLGSKFGMKMQMGVLPYRIVNEVVEFEPNRRIAWCHPGKHRWRYELEPTEGGTKVTETFDWSTSPIGKVLELVGYPKKHEGNIERTLERLDRYVTSTSSTL